MSGNLRLARDEFWTKDVDGVARRVHVPVEVGEMVEVSYELLAQMLTDLGWTKADDDAPTTAGEGERGEG